VRDPSNPSGPEFPVGDGHGYLWRLYTYWHFAEREGGVYIQCEAISLTRHPFWIGLADSPVGYTSIPKQSLDRVLAQTRDAVVHEPAPDNGSGLLSQGGVVAKR